VPFFFPAVNEGLRMISFHKPWAFFLTLAGLALQGNAVPTWDGCPAVADSEIVIDTLVANKKDALIEPMKMAFDLVAGPNEDAKDKVDIYFTQRLGEVRKYDSKQKKVVTLAKFPLLYKTTSLVTGAVSDGVLGIALDPAFKTNHRLYLYYTFKNDTETSWRVSRFTLDALNEHLDMASEQVVLKIPMILGSQHPGGALKFDDYGDLWITTGNDYRPADKTEFPIWSSGNTNDLRGKILRIHPVETAVDGKLYTIPDGNLFKSGTAKTLPEIYVMGARNAYTLSLDPYRRWAVWGDVGPDDVTMDGKPMNQPGAHDNTEENNVTTAPGNYGYPFFAGKNFVTKSGMDPAKPVISGTVDWGDAQPGLLELPPAIPALHAYPKACAITGPIYRYDGDLNSSIKLPPHFTRKWFITDFNNNSGTVLTLVTLSEDGKQNLGEEAVMTKFKAVKALDIQQGPDGALYVNNYAGYRNSGPGTTIVRIGYKGGCRPALPKLEKPSTFTLREAARPGPRLEIRTSKILSVTLFTNGTYELQLRDLLGRPVASRAGRGEATLSLPEADKAGVYLLSVKTPEGNITRKLILE
jgi:glucose/arabinose dehydrogenase